MKSIPAAAQAILSQSAPSGPAVEAPADEPAKHDARPLVAFLANRKRKTEPFDCPQFAEGAPGNVLVRVPTMGEQLRARRDCHAHIAELCKDVPTAAADKTIEENLQKTWLIYTAMRDQKEPDELPAFLTPEWLAEIATPQELSVLMNMYTETVKKTEPVEIDFSEERVGALMVLCAEHFDSDIPDKALLRFDRDGAIELFIKSSVMFADIARENQILKKTIAELEARLAGNSWPTRSPKRPKRTGSE